MRRSMLVGLVLLLAGMAHAGVAHGQMAPAGGGKKVVLDYQRVPVDAVLKDLQQKLGVIFIQIVSIPDRITLASRVEVAAEEVPSLLHETLWPLRYRLYELPQDKPGKQVFRVAARQDIPGGGEMIVWKRVPQQKITEDLPAELEGVSQTETMRLIYKSEMVGKILEDLGSTFGFVVDPGGVPRTRVTLLAPMPVHAREAVGLISELLATGGHKLQVNSVLDARGETRSLLRVVEWKVKEPPAEKVEFRFDNTPLAQVMDELGKRSGYAVTNEAGFVSVTIHETLTAEAFGTDVGALVAKLNAVLVPQGVVMQETSRPGAGGKWEPVLTAMPIDKARRTVLAAPAPVNEAFLEAKDWVAIDKSATMPFRYESVDMDSLLADYCARLGFIVMSDQRIAQRVTCVTPKPAPAEEAMQLLEDALVPAGYGNVVNVAESVNGTVIRVLPLAEARRYVRTGLLPQHQVAKAANAPGRVEMDPPLPPGSMDDIAQRMKARRDAQQTPTQPPL